MKNINTLKSILISSVIATVGAQAQVVYNADLSGIPAITWDTTVGGSGSYNVQYNRTSGSDGPSSFTQTYRFSAMSGSGHLWSTGGNLLYSGVQGSHASLAANIPASNQVPLAASRGINASVKAGIAANAINWLGQFSFTVDAAPTLAGLSLVSESIDVSAVSNAVNLSASGPGFWAAGDFANPIGGTLLSHASINAGDLRRFSHGNTITWDYTAWLESGKTFIVQDNRASLAVASAQYTYDAVPEPSSTALLGLGGLGLLIRRKR